MTASGNPWIGELISWYGKVLNARLKDTFVHGHFGFNHIWFKMFQQTLHATFGLF